jgi:hypothetical protein
MTSPTLSVRTTRIPLYQGDDLERIEELRADLERAKHAEGGPARVGDTGSGVASAKAALLAAYAEAKPRAVLVTVKALGRRQWRSLIEAHPPREGNREDDMHGGIANINTLQDPLVVASITEPEFPTPADRDDFLDALSDADFTSIFRAAFALNRVPGGDPKDLLAFEQITASDETPN